MIDGIPESPVLGERVLAQWEPGFLYPGVIEELAEGLALVSFDDGDAGWVSLNCVFPFVLEHGQDVLCRKPAGMLYYRGTIAGTNGPEVKICYSDESSEWVAVARIRIRCEPIEGFSQVVRRTSNFAFLEQLQVGHRVWGVWNRFAYFPGTLREFSDKQMLVEFDDGDRAWIFPADLLPLEIVPGMAVLVRDIGSAAWHSAIVSECDDERVQVRDEDEDETWTTVSQLALRLI